LRANTTLARAFNLIVHVLKPGIRGQVCASTLQYNTSQVFNGNFTNKILTFLILILLIDPNLSPTYRALHTWYVARGGDGTLPKFLPLYNTVYRRFWSRF